MDRGRLPRGASPGGQALADACGVGKEGAGRVSWPGCCCSRGRGHGEAALCDPVFGALEARSLGGLLPGPPRTEPLGHEETRGGARPGGAGGESGRGLPRSEGSPLPATRQEQSWPPFPCPAWGSGLSGVQHRFHLPLPPLIAFSLGKRLSLLMLLTRRRCSF